MKFAVTGDEAGKSMLKAAAPDAEWIFASGDAVFFEENGADAYFNLRSNACNADYSFTKAPVFINSVINTLTEKKFAENIIRINGWPGFTEKNIWEISGKITPAAEKALAAIGKKFIALPDEPGFVTARVIAMIINEAYFAKGENISSENDIDLAMKLGTNYPYGPFEWAKLIGLQNVLELLRKLSEKDMRYTPAPAMQSEMKHSS